MAEKKPNIFVRMFKRIGKYFHEVKVELKKVSWPDKKELRKTSTIVLITLVVLSLFIWLVDSVFAALIRLIA